MTFDAWLRLDGLSESSVLKYSAAIEGPLSEWAANAGLTAENILSIGSQSKCDALAIQIRKLQIFEERNSTGHNMYSSALNKYSEFLSKWAISSVDEDIEEIVTSPSIDATQKVRLVNARIGQGQFRKDLVDYWKRCAVTGFRGTSMLLASHIKPWSRSSNTERLDKFNGLLLVPNLDRAFDQGLVSFSESGAILISDALSQPGALGIDASMAVNLVAEHQPYMKFHRDYVFKSA